jgi:hypothetical protein
MFPKSLAGRRSNFVRWEFCDGYDLAHWKVQIRCKRDKNNNLFRLLFPILFFYF